MKILKIFTRVLGSRIFDTGIFSEKILAHEFSEQNFLFENF